jgi:hypothetical protein
MFIECPVWMYKLLRDFTELLGKGMKQQKLKEVPERIPFTFVNSEFNDICYQAHGVIYQWVDGRILGVCAGIRDKNPPVIVINNPPKVIR